MIDLVPYIIILILISAVAMVYIIKVLIKQVKLFRLPIIDQDVRHFRNVLFAISLTVIIMGLIPLAINVYTLFALTGRPLKIAPISLIYSLAVHLQTFFLSYLLWRIYRLATGDFNDKQK